MPRRALLLLGTVTLSLVLVAQTAAAAEGASTEGQETRISEPQVLAGPPQTGRSGPPHIAFRAGELAQVIAAYQALPAAADRSDFDVVALAAKIGGDPLRAFAFVRDHISLEIYPGVLRGAAGTLQAGAGNDLDRSLLLAALVAGSSHRVRFARCTLGPEPAARRVANMFDARATGTTDDVTAAFAGALRDAGVSQARSAEIAAARKQAREWLASSTLRTAREDLETLRTALSLAGLAPSGSYAPDSRVLEDAKDHYWLQLARGDTWQDLDPSAPAGPGATLCAAAETYDSLPKAAYQTITLSLRNEYVEGQSLRSETVLSKTFEVSSLYGQVITITNVGVPSPASSLLENAGFERFIPFARTPNEVHVGSEFTAVQGSGSAMETALDAFGGGEDPPLLGAQWLDFVLEAPGRRTSGSRALVDLIAPAERLRGVIVTRPESAIVILSLAQSAAIAVSAGAVHQLAAVETAFGDVDPSAIGHAFDHPGELAPARAEESPDGRADSEDALLRGVALAYAVHAESALVDIDQTQRAQVRLIRDQPMLTIANLAVRQRDGQSPVIELAVDLRHDQVRVVPRSSAEAATAFWANVLRGLADGALEHHLPELTIRSENAASRDEGSRIDTTGLLRLARAQGIELRAYSRRTTPDLETLITNAGGVATLGDLHDDIVVVMPPRSVTAGRERRFAMWAVDATTGHVLPLLDTGLRGQATAEGRLVRLINFLERQIRRCVASGANMARCRQMFQAWADAANQLRHSRSLFGRINVTNGNFTGFTF